MSSEHQTENPKKCAIKCRICLNENSKNMINIFVARNNSVPICQILTCIFPLNVIPNDGRPEHICLKCSAISFNFYKFQKLAIKSDSSFVKNHLPDKELCINDGDNDESELPTPPTCPDDHITLNKIVDVNSDSQESVIYIGSSGSESDSFPLHKETGSPEADSKNTATSITDDTVKNKTKIIDTKLKVAYLCRLCKMVFGSQERLNDHKDKHHPPKIEKANEERIKAKEIQIPTFNTQFCLKCEVYYTERTGIRTHKCVPKPFNCRNIIQSPVVHRNTLEQPEPTDHNKSHSINMVYDAEPSTTVNVNVNIQTEKSYDCSFCKMKFKYFEELDNHIKNHIKSIKNRIPISADDKGKDSKTPIKTLSQLRGIIDQIKPKSTIQKSNPLVCKEPKKINYPKINFVEVKRSNCTITQPNNDPLSFTSESIESLKPDWNTNHINLLASSNLESSTTSTEEVSKPLPMQGNSILENQNFQNVNNLFTDSQKRVIVTSTPKPTTTLGHFTVTKPNETNAVNKIVYRNDENETPELPAFKIIKAFSTKWTETNTSNSNDNSDCFITSIKREKEDCSNPVIDSKNIAQCEICGLFTLNEFKLKLHKNRVHQLNNETPSNESEPPQKKEIISNRPKFEEITLKCETVYDQVPEKDPQCLESMEINGDNDSKNDLPARVITRSKRRLIESSLQLESLNNKLQKLAYEKSFKVNERLAKRTSQRHKNQRNTAEVQVKTEKDDSCNEGAIEIKHEYIDDGFSGLLQTDITDNQNSISSETIDNNLQKRTCELCMKVFFDKKGKTRHTRAVHRFAVTPAVGHAKKYFTCVRCLKRYTNLKYVKLHEHYRESNPLRKTRSSPTTPLKKHGLGIYANEPSKCLDCDTVFVCRASLRRHMLRKHKDKCFPLNSQSYEYQCICTQPFENKKSLLNHMKKHSVPVTEERYFCHKCEYSQTTRWQVKRHLKVVHRLTTEKINELRWCVCSACKKFFSSKSGLNDHYRIHHGKSKY